MFYYIIQGLTNGSSDGPTIWLYAICLVMLVARLVSLIKTHFAQTRRIPVEKSRARFTR